MHELSIAMSLIDLAAEESERRGGVRVLSIHLKLGPLSGVVREALESAFELAQERSPVAGARLMIEEVPIVAFCGSCQAERPIESLQRICCSLCGTPATEIVSGRELELSALEIEA